MDTELPPRPLAPDPRPLYIDMLSILFTTTVILISTLAARTLMAHYEPEYRTRLEGFLFKAGIGLGLLSYLVMLLGFTQLLNRWAILAVFAILLVIGCLKLSRPTLNVSIQKLWHSVADSGWVVSFSLLGMAAIGFWVLIRALAPPIADDWDSLAYHLAVPKLYLQHGGFYFIPFTSHSNFPFTVEMLYTTALSFGLVPAAKLFHFAYWIFTLLAIYTIGRTYYGERTGAVAALIFASIPIAAWEATTAYIDLATTFYTVLAASALLAYTDSKDRRWLLLAGIVSGLAASTKMTALGTVLLLFVWVALAGWGRAKEKRKRILSDIAVLAVVSAVVAAPWYLKAWAYTGNPVYPFFYNIFGGRGWNGALAEQYRASQMQFGMGHRLADFVVSPWNLAIFSERFYDRPGFYVGFTLLAFLPLIALAFLRDRRCRALVLFALGFTGIWFMLSHQSRYLLPAFALLSVPAAAALVNMPGLKVTRAAGAAALALSVTFTFLYISQISAPAFNVAIGRESQRDYLSRSLDTYDMTEFINRSLPKNCRVILINDTRGFYLDRDYLWGDWAHNSIVPYRRMSTAEQFVSFLRSIKVTHVLIRDADNLPPGHETDLVMSAIDKGYLRAIESNVDFHAAVYEVAAK